MTTQQSATENDTSSSNSKLLQFLVYPNQASILIWKVNSDNLSQTSKQIIDFIRTNKISVEMAFYLIDVFSKIQEKNIKNYLLLYLQIKKEFSRIIKPTNERLAALLFYQGIKFEYFHTDLKEEEIYNLFPTESPLYYIAWDKIDDLKIKFPKLNVRAKIRISSDQRISPLDCACKYGSELCFNYLRNMGARYTKQSDEYAVQGGNKTIFSKMIEDGRKFDDLINTAFNYRNFEIAEFLQSNFGQIPKSLPLSLHFGNYKLASYLISHGTNLNKRSGSDCPLIIAIKQNSFEMMEYLIKHGADINRIVRRDCPLTIAIKQHSLEIVKYLIDHGADVNLKLKNDCPLSISSLKGTHEITRYLRVHGAYLSY